MNSIFAEAWAAFMVSDEKFIRYIFVKTKLLPFSPPNITIITQVCVASVQVSFGDKSEEINEISLLIVAPI